MDSLYNAKMNKCVYIYIYIHTNANFKCVISNIWIKKQFIKTTNIVFFIHIYIYIYIYIYIHTYIQNIVVRLYINE